MIEKLSAIKAGKVVFRQARKHYVLSPSLAAGFQKIGN
jgi:hypothetical protein